MENVNDLNICGVRGIRFTSQSNKLNNMPRTGFLYRSSHNMLVSFRYIIRNGRTSN